MAQVIENQVIKLEHIVYSQKKEVELLAKKAMNKAKKFGIAAPNFEYSEKYLHHFEATDYYGGDEFEVTPMIEEVFDVTITIPEEMKLEGDWNLFAFIHHDLDHIEQFDLTQVLPVEYGTHTKKCDHCQRKQSRAKSYIIQNKTTGEFMQVGTTCLKDFLGINPDKWIKGYEAVSFFSNIILDSRGEFRMKNCGFHNVAHNVKDALALASYWINKDGYIKQEWKTEKIGEGRWGDEYRNVRTNEGEATMDKVAAYLEALDYNKREGGEFNSEIVLDNHRDLPQEYINYFEELEVSKTGKTWKTDYETMEHYEVDDYTDFEKWLLSVKSEAGNKLARMNEIKTVIAGFGYYIKNKERIAEREAEIAAGKLSSHYGEVKKRYKGIEVVCTMKIFRDNDWGGSYIQKLKVGNDILVYFGNALEELKKDEKAIIDFTVKEHGEFRGELNTKINRPKIVK